MRGSSPGIRSRGFNLSDRRAYIKLLQAMLGLRASGRIDGAFREKVKLLQRAEGHLDDGIVDRDTFEMIRKAYKEDKRVYRQFDFGEEVLKLNNDMGILIRSYRLNIRVPKGRYITFDSLRAISTFQRLYCLEEKPYADAKLLKCILSDLRSINAISPQPIRR